MYWVLLGTALTAAYLTGVVFGQMSKRRFRPEKTVYNLKFEGGLEGLDVKATALPLGDFLEINELAIMVGQETDPEKLVEKTDLLFRRFAEHLIEWNVDDDNDEPVPATFEGVKTQELPFVQEVIRAWMDAIASIPKTQQNDSNGSGTLEVPPLAMEPLSASLPS